MRLVTVCLLATLSAADAQEVTRGSWQQVMALTPGERIRVEEFGGKRITGRLAAATPDSVTIATSSGESKFERAGVRQVSVRRASARTRNAAIGAAVGAGVGVGLSVALLAAGGGSDAAREIVAAGTAIGAGIGFGLGWIPSGYATMYKARR